MTLRFRTKIFLAAFIVGAVTAVVAGALMQWWVRRLTVERIEGTLTAETRLLAELLARNPGLPVAELDEEADRLGALAGVRVTFVAPDGRVIGDSEEDGADLAAMENHLRRPEILAARNSRDPVLVSRYSTTTDYETLYSVVPIVHPALAYVRLSLPLTTIASEQRAVRWLMVAGVAASLPVAAMLAWVISLAFGRRVARIAAAARRYATGDLTQPAAGYADDELGQVARALDGAVHELGKRLGELAHDRGHLRALLASMMEGVIVLDVQGRLVMANEAARAMLKLDDGATGRRYQEWMRQPELFAQLAQAMQGEAPSGVEFVLARDPSRTCIARAAPVGNPDGGVMLVLHDISDLRRADRVRRDFVANVSHELRTPLTAIRGYVETLLDDPPTEPEQARKFLEIIARHTSRMERLVKDLLRLARLDAGQETPDLTDCDLEAVVQSVATDFADAVAAKGGRLEIAIAPAARRVISDAARLHDVLRNLLENAVNYSPDGATVTIEASRDDGAITLRVLDRGPGIPETDLTRVFERFYRVDKSRTHAPGGTGIGLAIVRHLVELLGGAVAASNQPEGGAAFTVRLPER